MLLMNFLQVISKGKSPLKELQQLKKRKRWPMPSSTTLISEGKYTDGHFDTCAATHTSYGFQSLELYYLELSYLHL